MDRNENRRNQMAKFLYQASYTDTGLKGLLKEGGSSRRAAVAKAVKGAGGTLEAFYYAFGYTDVFAIVDLPDNVDAAALALQITAAGGAKVKTTVLLTPEEIDQATKKIADYRPPGG
jgi:uncharacterized protein with GYD domain